MNNNGQGIDSMNTSLSNPIIPHGSNVLNTPTSMSTVASFTAPTPSSHFHNNSRSSNSSMDASNQSNTNASSYWNVEQRETDGNNPGTAGTLTASSIMDDGSTKSSDFNTTFGSSAGHRGNDNLGSLKLELQLKETQIESLENEIQKLKVVFNQGLTFKQQEQKQKQQMHTSLDSNVQIPISLETIFSKLSASLQRKDEELEETKKRLESIITAIALNPSNSVTKFGRYDEETLAHKMVVRLEMLTKENQEMAKMLGYGRSKETHIELELLKKENQQLKEKIEQLEKQMKK